ncbi:Clavaminate synthase-like protein, partial [Dendrothele bispora CBS 962.96]
TDYHNIPDVTLKHGHHSAFHQTRIPPEEEQNPPNGVTPTRFFRWHMDAALYDLEPPKVTTLYGIRVPQGPKQVVRYDDGTGDELPVPLGTTAFVSGKTMFEMLPPELKSLAVRARAKYAPRPFAWIKDAKAMSTGLGIATKGLEKNLDELDDWDEEKVKTYPFLWKNRVTHNLHFMVHPCAVREIFVDPLPADVPRRETHLYADGAHLTDLDGVRTLLYRMQRPAIAPRLVYPHDWNERDLMVFHNRGLMHSVVGLFREDDLRVFHQCNLAATDQPEGPSEEDRARIYGLIN